MSFRLIFVGLFLLNFLHNSHARIKTVTIIVCGDRSAAVVASNKSETKAAEELLCYPGGVTVTLPDECNSGKVLLSFQLDPAVVLSNEALTLVSLENIFFEDGSQDFEDSLAVDASYRAAFAVDEDDFVEIEFTRDPALPTIIELANASLVSGGKIITIPACTGTIFNGDAALVPTMGQWGILSLGLILLIFGMVAVMKYTPTTVVE